MTGKKPYNSSNSSANWTVHAQEDESAEDRLDALLTVHQWRSRQRLEDNAAAARNSRIDAFRHKLCDELAPAFEEIKQKYRDQDIKLDLDASDFLSGGRKLVIEFTVQSHSVYLDGTVMESGIAFNEIRSVGGVPGAICSGPMLATRQLTSRGFREFVCNHIALLVRSILRQKR
ncbi:MAG: hypothetical protein KAV82_15860 [Phycisphaerae bacterium]|nr:hypothetical protein [Phycisphaerae bacterium]